MYTKNKNNRIHEKYMLASGWTPSMCSGKTNSEKKKKNSLLTSWVCTWINIIKIYILIQNTKKEKKESNESNSKLYDSSDKCK